MLPPGEALADLEILSLVGKTLAAVLEQGPEQWPRDPEAVLAEIGRIAANYAGLTYEALGSTGVRTNPERVFTDRWEFQEVEG